MKTYKFKHEQTPVQEICASIDKLTDMLSWMPMLELNQFINSNGASIDNVSTACENILEQMKENQEVLNRIADALEELANK